jgi:putative ABC transport system permease protein
MQEALRRTIAAVDKDQTVIFIKTLEQLKSESMIGDRLRSSLLGVFAAIALLLSAIGIYGVISYSVVQRTRELGIRAALGANAGDLMRLIVGGGAALTATGQAFGCVGALAATRLLKAFLFGVGSSDAITWIVAAGILGAVATIACYIPALHVTRIDPLEALRSE